MILTSRQIRSNFGPKTVGVSPRLGEVGRPKSELGEQGIIMLILIGGTSVIESDDEIVEETAKRSDFRQIRTCVLSQAAALWDP